MFFLAYYSQKVVLIRKEKKIFHIELLRTLNPDVKPLYILKPILHEKRFEVVTGLETKDVLLRTLSLKLKSKREILAALPFQVEALLPYSQEELLLLPTLYPEKTQTTIFLLASSKNALKHHLGEVANLSLDPDKVSCIPLALFRFARYFFPKQTSFFVNHSDKAHGTFIVVKEGRLLAFQAYKPQDFQRVCAYMQKNYPEIQHILNTGETTPSSPFTPLKVEDPNMLEYAVPIGLALDAAKDDMLSGQFRQKNLISRKQRKKRAHQLKTFFTACSCFVFVTLFMGNLLLRKQEKTVLEALGSPKEMRLSQVVEQLQSGLRPQKKTSVQLPTIPRVYEVLTWLSTHPAFKEECSITHLRYYVTKAPKLGSQIKTYAAKVELELSIPDSRVARAIHEALLKETTMIDQKSSVQWSADHGSYRANFQLKPKQTR